MPRTRRKISKTGIYHIMIRGNEKKNIFLDDSDRVKFIKILLKIKHEELYELFSYCIMPNHVHLIIKDNTNNISNIMKKINTTYALYFNYKYDRVGHVFQDRFRSEVIENDRYLLCAIRYIHNNPVKANMVNDPLKYEWSSYKEYTTKYKYIVDINFPLSLYNEDRGQVINLFKKFTMESNDDKFIDVKENLILNKSDCKKIIEEYCKICNVEFADIINIKAYRHLRNNLIKKIKEDSSLSLRELENILGVSKSTINRV